MLCSIKISTVLFWFHSSPALSLTCGPLIAYVDCWMPWGVWGRKFLWAWASFFWRAFLAFFRVSSASLFELITRGATALCSGVWCGTNSSKNLRRGTAGFAPCFQVRCGLYHRIYPSFSFILPKARQHATWHGTFVEISWRVHLRALLVCVCSARAIAHRLDFRVCVLNPSLVTEEPKQARAESKKRYISGSQGPQADKGDSLLTSRASLRCRRRALYTYARKEGQAGSRGKSSRRAKQDGGRRRLGGGGRHDGSEEGWWNCRRTCACDFGGVEGGY